MLIRLLLAFAVRRDLTVRGQGQAIQTLTSKYKEKPNTETEINGRDLTTSLAPFVVRSLGTMSGDWFKETHFQLIFKVAGFLMRRRDETKSIWREVSGRGGKMDGLRSVLALKLMVMPDFPVFSPMKILFY